MILLIDTTKEHVGQSVLEQLRQSDAKDYDLIDTTDQKIAHCIGCNHCWLKTPGICSIKDDYENILKKLVDADQMWVVADTKFGFISYEAKDVIDRILPLVTMYLKFTDGQMRHVMRYDKKTDFGVIYHGDGDADYLNYWSERVAVNFGSRSLGAYKDNQIKEAVSCMS